MAVYLPMPTEIRAACARIRADAAQRAGPDSPPERHYTPRRLAIDGNWRDTDRRLVSDFLHGGSNWGPQ